MVTESLFPQFLTCVMDEEYEAAKLLCEKGNCPPHLTQFITPSPCPLLTFLPPLPHSLPLLSCLYSLPLLPPAPFLVSPPTPSLSPPTVLEYEPGNATAQEFLPVILERMKLGETRVHPVLVILMQSLILVYTQHTHTLTHPYTHSHTLDR